MPRQELDRPQYRQRIETALDRSPIVALLGPRQCGKTTLASTFAATATFDLDRSADRAALGAAPELTLQPLEGLVVIDEAQQLPGLFPALRVLADRRDRPARFLLLGSASPELVRGASESLAGRVAFVDLSGFDIGEVGDDHVMRLWNRGGFPRSFLAGDDAASFAWRQDFIDTFLTRDAAQFGIQLAPEGLLRFWTMIAHLHGGQLNVAELGRALSIDQKTAQRYVDILAGTFLLRRLPPWFTNTKKRVVKSPKVYVRDSGVLHALLGLRDGQEVLRHPRFGFSWEGFAIEHVISCLMAGRDAHYWAVHSGPELDLVVPRGGRLYGFECKFGDAPTVTPSMRAAMAELELERLFVVYPGARTFELEERITAVALTGLRDAVGGL